MKTDPEDNTLSYEVFDRQLNNFYRMLHVLMEGWDDYSHKNLHSTSVRSAPRPTASATWQCKTSLCSIAT